MKDLNIRIKQKFNEVIPFDEKGTTWAAFLNILITSKEPEDVMKYLGVYEAEEIDENDVSSDIGKSDNKQPATSDSLVKTKAMQKP